MKRTTVSRTALVLAAPLVLAACGLSDEGGTTTDTQAGDKVEAGLLDGVAVTVGSKDFDEQFVLGELALQTLSAAGADVTNALNIKGSTATREALIRGDIDVYYDYTGTGWITYLAHEENIPDE
nr:glycine/betaine ABC transporter substrate-binding protein [Nocardioidaceae bacterium]